MLTYEQYIKNWPKDYSETKLKQLYGTYYVTESICEMKSNTLNFAVPMPAVCAFECAPACEAPKKSKFGAKVCNKEEVDNNMTTYNEIEASRKYLNGRINSVMWQKRDDMVKQFRMHNSEQPRTYKELIDAIKNDLYTIDTKRAAQIDGYVEDDDWYGNAMDGIKFNLPTAPDRAGYDAATKEFEKAVNSAKDIINTGTPADGLKALQELEAWTYITKQ
jgi:hypothetical protein